MSLWKKLGGMGHLTAADVSSNHNDKGTFFNVVIVP